MKAHGGSFCSSWDGGPGKIFGGHFRCVLNIYFGVARCQFSQRPLVWGRRPPGSTWPLGSEMGWTGKVAKSGFYGFCRTQLFSDSPPYLSCLPPNFIKSFQLFIKFYYFFFYKILSNLKKAYQTFIKFYQILQKLTKITKFYQIITIFWQKVQMVD